MLCHSVMRGREMTAHHHWDIIVSQGHPHISVPFLLLRLIEHNDQKIAPYCESVIEAHGDSRFIMSSRCSSRLWHLFLWNFFLFPLTTVFSLSACLSNGSPCLIRYVVRATAASVALRLHVSLIVEELCLQDCSSVCELWLTSDIIPVLSLRSCRCVEELKHWIVPLKGHEAWEICSSM